MAGIPVNSPWLGACLAASCPPAGERCRLEVHTPLTGTSWWTLPVYPEEAGSGIFSVPPSPAPRACPLLAFLLGLPFPAPPLGSWKMPADTLDLT